MKDSEVEILSVRYKILENGLWSVGMVMQLLNTGVFDVNTYIVKITDSTVFIVDPAACALSNDENKITDYLAAHNLICEAVLLTHCHFDHITGIRPIIEKFPNAKIAISEIDAPELGLGHVNEFCLRNMNLWFLKEILENTPKPNLLLHDGDDFYGWKVLHTPGHTAGSICLYNEKENELISGDTLFFQSYGRTDLPTGDERTMMKTLKWISENIPNDVELFPGH